MLRNTGLVFTITLLANGRLQVADLESANGTFINERPIKDATARSGDLIPGP